MTKPCIACSRNLPISAYYKHPMMADGHLNKCKQCVIAYQSRRLAEKTATVEGRMAERERGREKYHRLYRGLKPNPNSRRKATRAYDERARKNGKAHARSVVAYAIKQCRLARMPCRDCGSKKTEAHHPDYSKPLDVIWLCRQCHAREHHKKD